MRQTRALGRNCEFEGDWYLSDQVGNGYVAANYVGIIDFASLAGTGFAT